MKRQKDRRGGRTDGMGSAIRSDRTHELTRSPRRPADRQGRGIKLGS